MAANRGDNHQDNDAAGNQVLKEGRADAADSTSGGSRETAARVPVAGKGGEVPVEEQLERLTALNLGGAYASRSRFSPTIIRILSAAAGIAALLLIYFCFKLFI